MEVASNRMEQMFETEIVLKEEFEPIQIKEEQSADEIGESFTETEFVDADLLALKDIKTEETLSISDAKMTAPIPQHQLKFELKNISFIHASYQFTKQYQIKVKPNMNQFKDNYILTSGPGLNNTSTEWKLFIPVTCDPIPAHHLENIAVEYDQESGCFDFTYFSSNMIVRNVEDLTSFMQGILGGKILLVTKQNLQQISKQFEAHFKTANPLIPTFTHKAEKAGSFVFKADLPELGYEGVPKELVKEDVSDNIKTASLVLETCIPAQLTMDGVTYQFSSAREKRNAQYHNMSAGQKQARLKERKKAQYLEMNAEEKEAYRKRMREQRRAHRARRSYLIVNAMANEPNDINEKEIEDNVNDTLTPVTLNKGEFVPRKEEPDKQS
eukprot:GFUD01083569.1.p1 GENE.GFUD01083569.1~~GFUD01083569.1.p1  ORF type:complete len:384 (+),score=102.00 GFUD01083569.1:95-1246(+)